MPRLTIQTGDEKGRVFVIRGSRASMGRGVNNDLQIVDRRMSRNHAEVFDKDGAWYARDLGSKNGTLVNGAAITLPVRIHSGDRVTVGETDVLFEDDSASAVHASGRALAAPLPTPASDSNATVVFVDDQQLGLTRGEVRAGVSATPIPVEAVGTALGDTSRRLEIIYQVTEAIRSVFEIDDLLDAIMDIVMEVFRPDSAYLLVRDGQTGEIRPEVVKTSGDDGSEVRISRSIVNRCLDEGVGLLVGDAAMDKRFSEAESIILHRIRTAMAAPLLHKSEPLGVVYVDTRQRTTPYTREELELLAGITSQAALAIVNARLHSQIVEQHKLAREMEIARTIQMNLLPKVYPDMRGFEVSAMSLPAKDVGGDYYDFTELPDGRLGIAIADVSGKGVPAAILTATTRSYVQAEGERPDQSPARAAARINRMVHRDVTNDMYVTMVLMHLDRDTGAFDYVNCGHCHPTLLRVDGSTDSLDKGGLFLGIMEDSEYESGSLRMEPGDVLLLMTDGVSDILDPKGRPFTEERVLELLRENAPRTAEEIRNAIYDACVAHRADADQFDDFTLIVLKRTAAAPAAGPADPMDSDLFELDLH